VTFDANVAAPVFDCVPATVILDEKVAIPPYDDVNVTTNELAVVVPEPLAKVRAALPAAVPALL
jgi:hypothetical protein